MRKRLKGDVEWHVPGRKTPVAYSTKATSDLIVTFAGPGLTIADVQARIIYDPEARAVLQVYIDKGYGGQVACEWFR